jgi:hypothetical protein
VVFSEREREERKNIVAMADSLSHPGGTGNFQFWMALSLFRMYTIILALVLRFGIMGMRSRTILILLASLALMSGVQCQKEFVVPEELIGVWVTDDPNYFDRPFEITKSTVIFEQGLGYFDFHVFPIWGVKKGDSEEAPLYIIYYTSSSGRKFEFSFYYTSANGGEIRFKNQPEMKWTKKQR